MTPILGIMASQYPAHINYPSYDSIATVTVGSGGASTINFTSIPQTYTDLCLKISARNSDTGTANNLYVGFNSSTSDQSARKLVGNGSSASASTDGNIIVNMTAASATANTFNNAEIYIPNYTSIWVIT